MQGRLSEPIEGKIQAFPKKTWEQEFEKAEKIGFDLIEWVFDSYDNPIMTDEGLSKIRNCLENSNIGINSVCADFFMKNLLFDLPKFELQKNLEILSNLIEQCSKLEIKIIELPFVDSSSLLSKNKTDEILSNLQEILPLLEKFDIYLNLETDLPPNQFYNLLKNFNGTNVKANYDIGNSISKGYDPVLELTTLRNYIYNIHIKDRLFQGTTVPLGQGDVNFDLFFSILSKINYQHDLIIQGFREDLTEQKIEPEKTCVKYLTFVKNYLSKNS